MKPKRTRSHGVASGLRLSTPPTQPLRRFAASSALDSSNCCMTMKSLFQLRNQFNVLFLARSIEIFVFGLYSGCEKGRGWEVFTHFLYSFSPWYKTHVLNFSEMAAFLLKLWCFLPSMHRSTQTNWPDFFYSFFLAQNIQKRREK